MGNMGENTKKESIVNQGVSFKQIGPSESERRKWLIACGATGGAAAVALQRRSPRARPRAWPAFVAGGSAAVPGPWPRGSLHGRGCA